jgi:cytochrome b561
MGDAVGGGLSDRALWAAEPAADRAARSRAIFRAANHTHSALAFLLFATFIAHFNGAMLHTLVIRDGVFESMAAWKKRPQENPCR